MHLYRGQQFRRDYVISNIIEPWIDQTFKGTIVGSARTTLIARLRDRFELKIDAALPHTACWFASDGTFYVDDEYVDEMPDITETAVLFDRVWDTVTYEIERLVSHDLLWWATS